jgi:hypothetical protein
MKNNNHMEERLNVHYPLSINYQVTYMYKVVTTTQKEKDVGRKRYIIIIYLFFFFLWGRLK